LGFGNDPPANRDLWIALDVTMVDHVIGTRETRWVRGHDDDPDSERIDGPMNGMARRGGLKA
jgi:ribonuclease HI